MAMVLLWAGTCCLFSCSPANNKPVSIRFSADSTAIVFADVDPAGLLALKNTAGITTHFSSLLTVMETPAEDDTTGREVVVPGKIYIAGRSVVFRPQTPFLTGKSYLVISYIHSGNGGMINLLKGKVQAHSAQQLLQR